jgi:hypothetical protein
MRSSQILEGTVRELDHQLGALPSAAIAEDGYHLANLRCGHFFRVAPAVVLLALLRPSYFGSRAGTDRFLLFRLLIN